MVAGLIVADYMVTRYRVADYRLHGFNDFIRDFTKTDIWVIEVNFKLLNC